MAQALREVLRDRYAHMVRSAEGVKTDFDIEFVGFSGKRTRKLEVVDAPAALRRGEPIQKPCYDFTEHVRRAALSDFLRSRVRRPARETFFVGRPANDARLGTSRHAGANTGTALPSSAFLNTSLTLSPMFSASGSQSTMFVIIDTPSSSVT